MTLREIGPKDVDRYKAAKRVEEHQFGKGYSAHSINNQLSVLHRLLEKAVEYGHLERNPISKSAWLHDDKTPEDGENWWTPDDEAKAVKALRQVWRERRPREYHTLLVQLILGLRFSELRALEKKDLDLNAGGIWGDMGAPLGRAQGAEEHLPTVVSDGCQPAVLHESGELLVSHERAEP